MAKLKKESFIEALKEMSIKDVMELVDAMKEEFGIDPTAVVAAGPATTGAETEEKTEFNIILSNVGANKVQVIKVVKAATGLGLMDAKKLTDNVPSTIKEAVSKDEAEELIKQLKEVGAEAKME